MSTFFVGGLLPFWIDKSSTSSLAMEKLSTPSTEHTYLILYVIYYILLHILLYYLYYIVFDWCLTVLQARLPKNDAQVLHSSEESWQRSWYSSGRQPSNREPSGTSRCPTWCLCQSLLLHVKWSRGLAYDTTGVFFFFGCAGGPKKVFRSVHTCGFFYGWSLC